MCLVFVGKLAYQGGITDPIRTEDIYYYNLMSIICKYYKSRVSFVWQTRLSRKLKELNQSPDFTETLEILKVKNIAI